MRTSQVHSARARARHTLARRLRTAALTASALLSALIGTTRSVFAQSGPEYGPSKGTLLIVGGGQLDGSGIYEKFIELAGGPSAKIVVVPTAGGNKRGDGTPIVYHADTVLASWRKMGLTNVHMLHTHDPAVANTPAFAEMLRDARAVWFVGGRQWNIVDSYANTLTFKAFHDVLARGGVIGGSSAGATIQGEYLVRGAIAGAQIMMAPEPEHQQAFGFLRRSAIDQHINTRNRWNDLQQVIGKFPNLLGIGISEATAIVVRGDQFEVMGKAQVAIHDSTHPQPTGEKPYVVLEAGDRYDMKARAVQRR
ncbi:MAG: cyanophycinase [Gemmatimonadaceae bacterium]|jgi:cyanophycinase|nr:cyanophycinase [Gemmatimonadaceae bacterium]